METKELRKILTVKEWAALVREGLAGSREAFAQRVRRLASRVQPLDPVLADVLVAELDRQPGLRAFHPEPVDGDSRLKLLNQTFPVVLARDPVWPAPIRETLDAVVREWKEAPRLRAAGLTPTRSVLLYGPPGVGKTLTAAWLAMQLEVPLLTLDLATVMNSFLGRTGQNLKTVLDYAAGVKAVLLLDEFDAIAKRRDDEGDVGELKRLVNVLLQAIDDWSGEALLVAATNHPDLLDAAIWRRFDLSLALATPPVTLAASFLEELGLPSSQAAAVAHLAAGESFAHLERWFRSARKTQVLSGEPLMASLLAQLARDRGPVAKGKAGRDLRIVQLHMEGKTNREIAEVVGVTHPTVGSVLRKMSGGTDGQT